MLVKLRCSGSELARQDGVLGAQVVETMSAMNESARKIVDSIRVIESYTPVVALASRAGAKALALKSLPATSLSKARPKKAAAASADEREELQVY